MINKKNNHLLISGLYRSGSGLLTCILNANQSVSASTDIIKYWSFCYGRYPILNETNYLEMLKELVWRLKARFSIEIDLDSVVHEVGSNISHSAIYDAVLSDVFSMDKESYIRGECESLIWSKVPYFIDQCKNPKVISIVRDPHDVLVSFKKNTIAPEPLYLVTIFNTLGYLQSVLKYKQQFQGDFLYVRYEDLKKNMVDEVQRICDFLDIEFSHSMLDSSNWTKLSNHKWLPWENLERSSFKENHELKVNPVGRWRDLISESDHFLCEWTNKTVLEEFGYDSTFKNGSPELLKTELLKLLDNELLSSCLYDFVSDNKGSEKYPIDPFLPENWDKRFIDNPEIAFSKV